MQLSIPLEDGPTRQIDVLVSDPRRKVVRIVLRRNAVLREHTALHPITVQCLDGAGVLTVEQQRHALQPGTLIPVDAHVVHEVTADPHVSILVTFFRGDEVPRPGLEVGKR